MEVLSTPVFRTRMDSNLKQRVLMLKITIHLTVNSTPCISIHTRSATKAQEFKQLKGTDWTVSLLHDKYQTSSPWTNLNKNNTIIASQ